MHSNTNRSVISVILAAIMLLSTVLLAYSPEMNSFAAEDYTKWKQADPRWSSNDMSGDTMGASGCLVTSIAMMAMHSGSIDSAAAKNMGISSPDKFNPGVLCDAYRNRNGFVHGCIAYWRMIDDIVPAISFVRDSHLSSTSRSGIAQEVKAMLNSGLHVILNVNGHHWVYVYAASDNDLYMMDPASKSKTASVFDEYGVYGNNEYWALKGAKVPAKSGGILVDALKKKVTPKQTSSATTTKVTTTAAKTTTTTTKATTTKATTTTTTTTTTTSTTTSTTTATGTAIEPVEYSYNGDTEMPVYDSVKEGTSDYSLNGGESFVIYAVYKDYGRIATSDGKGLGWVDINELTPANTDETASAEHIKGDIDGNGVVDMYDLSLLNDYLKRKAELPDGISVLRSDELKAADINGDGAVDNNDVTEYLKLLISKE